uniref:NADH-ubiquinone oxidoreductase chain 1 n=1 Tax=Histeroidea sp. 3 KM-2017 TaxID=2219436 RepID=A0A346RIF3_9COLE|nr:NADH dehydrogenase subunit 1 [Histeroidea sp. 3 KM-2017]
MLLLNVLLMLIGVLVGVAFLTLLERKVLGYVQARKGPNKVGFIGILQPFSDAVKLFTKEQVIPSFSNYIIFYLCPVFTLFISLSLWISFPYWTNLLSFNYSILFILCISSLGVYGMMFAGWSSNSEYSLLGSLRSIAQSVSYEVSLFLIFLAFLILICSLNLLVFIKFQNYVWFLFTSFPLCLVMFVSSLAETNRTPFDFAEGESELVSGFNVEYSSGGFALLFLGEYSSILFMSVLCCFMFLGGNIYNFMFFFKVLFLVFLWVWVRGTLPRYRYDKLMYLAWKSFLPLTLNYLLFYYGLKICLFSHIF